MKELTKAEEEVMLVLWDLRRGFVKDILERFPEPRPAYNTVSTIVRILEKKGFVDHRSFGKSYEYFPAIERESYMQFAAGRLLDGYFQGSLRQLVSFFVDKEQLSQAEVDQLRRLLEKQSQS